MAITKEITSEFGAIAKYWVIGSINASFENTESVIVRMDGYIDEQAYQNGMKKLTTKTMQVEVNNEFRDLIFSTIEEQVKNKKEFK